MTEAPQKNASTDRRLNELEKRWNAKFSEMESKLQQTQDRIDKVKREFNINPNPITTEQIDEMGEHYGE